MMRSRRRRWRYCVLYCTSYCTSKHLDRRRTSDGGRSRTQDSGGRSRRTFPPESISLRSNSHRSWPMLRSSTRSRPSPTSTSKMKTTTIPCPNRSPALASASSIIALDLLHQSLADASEISKAADSQHCDPPLDIQNFKLPSILPI